MPTTRDISFDEECPDAPAHVLDNFADIRPLVEVEAMQRKWADRFRQRIVPIAGHTKRPTHGASSEPSTRGGP